MNDTNTTPATDWATQCIVIDMQGRCQKDCDPGQLVCSDHRIAVWAAQTRRDRAKRAAATRKAKKGAR